MAFCTNCGAKVSEGTKFCPDCGHKIVGSETVTPAAPLQETPLQAAQVQPVQKEEAKQPEAPVQGAYQAVYTPPTAQQNYTPTTQQSYTPPTQQSYTPPTQQSYTPPVQQAAPQQTYTPPTQQSYQAPNVQGAYAQQGGYQSQQGNSQQSYSAQPAYAPTARAPKQKKPMNKKTLFIIGGAVLALILAIVLIGVLGGKDGETAASSDPNAGVYNAVSAEMMGMVVDIDTVWTEGFTIELMDKGKCAMEIDGTKATGKWTLDGTDFHIEGGGLDCDGTLASGKLELENVLNMGITLTFAREGGAVSQPGGASAGGVSDASASELQKQWNGTWYGCLYVSEATGAFADIPSDFYDVYMVVDVDASGKGQFAVFLDGVDEAFALANCEAKESGLYAIDGTIAGGEEMYAYNWMFLPMPDYPDQYTMGDIIENGDSIFDFKLFMKQWGGSWQKEIDSNFAIVPPSVEWYNGAIERGELPPVGFAPIGYAGISASSGVQGLEPGEVPDDQMEPQPLINDEYDTSSFAGILDLEGKGLVELSYPDDSFVETDRHTIKCQSKRIFFTTIYVFAEGYSGISDSNDYMSSLSTSEDFADTQVTIGGFPARRVTCIDDYFKEPFVYYLIDTSSAGNPDAGAVYIKVNIKDTADYPLVDAIVSTIKVK